MKREPLIMSEKLVQTIRRTLQVTIGVTSVWLTVSGFVLAQTSIRTSILATENRSQWKALADIRQSTKKQSTDSVPVDLRANKVLARLQTDLERMARSVNCSINEFQAASERGPYISSFSLENSHPDWEQIPVHLTLSGTLAATLATVESIRSSDTPIEPDSIEISRQTITDKGIPIVALRLSFRVLVRGGGTS